MDGVLVLIPVLNRPHRVVPTLESIRVSQRGVPLDVLFLASRGDTGEINALKKAGAEHKLVGHRDDDHQYAVKNNAGIALAIQRGYEWVFLGADDLDFGHGWADEAVELGTRTRACVVGTQDGVNARVKTGRHSTHSLVNTAYIDCGTVDRDDVVLTEEYGHWFVDDEFVQTAVFRSTFVMASRAVVEHRHPNYGHAEMDATYEKGQATVAADQALYASRKWMWGR